mmetsp:Transcript_21169/g.68507  ORF Transcript_21169/g.68507 Transcript_21169/m.68507 type:complete len:237 (+) Transcript_21169:132-842(+)
MLRERGERAHRRLRLFSCACDAAPRATEPCSDRLAITLVRVPDDDALDAADGGARRLNLVRVQLEPLTLTPVRAARDGCRKRRPRRMTGEPEAIGGGKGRLPHAARLLLQPLETLFHVDTTLLRHLTNHRKLFLEPHNLLPRLHLFDNGDRIAAGGACSARQGRGRCRAMSAPAAASPQSLGQRRPHPGARSGHWHWERGKKVKLQKIRNCGQRGNRSGAGRASPIYTTVIVTDFS